MTFWVPVTAASPLAHPNKAKDHVLLHEGEEPTPDLKASASASPRLPRQEPASKVAQGRQPALRSPRPWWTAMSPGWAHGRTLTTKS